MFAHITGFYIMLVRSNKLIRKILSEYTVWIDDVVYNSGKTEAKNYYQNRREEPSSMTVTIHISPKN
jgi:hypothetical protein